MKKSIFKIEGMHCTSCSMSIDDVLEELPGVLKVSTSYAKSITTIEYDGQKTSVEDIENEVKKIGYSAIVQS